MGYTRYWSRTNKPITEEFIEEVNEILKDCARKGIAIRDYDGIRKPTVSLECIAFNGNGKEGLDHESFVIDNNESDFEFCKTARKPYDYAVRKVLRLAEKHGLVYDIASDGRNEKVYSDEEYLSGAVEFEW